jgi:mRNA-degrading endonuclease RelE of RelBE toxin-antitoxin system
MVEKRPFVIGGIAPDAKNFIESCQDKIKQQLVNKIHLLLQNPFGSTTKQLQNQVLYGLPVRRIKSGEYRILYTVNDKDRTVMIVDAGPRKDIYEKW